MNQDAIFCQNLKMCYSCTGGVWKMHSIPALPLNNLNVINIFLNTTKGHFVVQVQ